MSNNQEHFSSKPKQITKAAIEVCKRVFGNLSNLNIITINNTDITQTIFESFSNANVKKLTQIKSPKENFLNSINHNGPMEIIHKIKKYDILVLGSPIKNTLIECDKVISILKLRKQKPIVFIDCGIPGNVDSRARKISNCFIFDLNDLEQIYSQNFQYEMGNNNLIDKQNEIEIILQKFYTYLNFTTAQKVSFENKFRKFLETGGLSICDTIKDFLKTFK